MTETPEFTLDQLTGQARDHLAELPTHAAPCIGRSSGLPGHAGRGGSRWHRSRGVLQLPGLRPAAGIWNGKFRGERPMQDRAGNALDALALPPAERVERHPLVVGAARRQPTPLGHRLRRDGCRRAMPPGYRLQVVPGRIRAGGPFHRLTTWLDAHMHAFGFFRPYTTDRGGVSPEPWHLSYAPVARARAARRCPSTGCAGCWPPPTSKARRKCWQRSRAEFPTLRGQRGRAARGGAAVARLA